MFVAVCFFFPSNNWKLQNSNLKKKHSTIFFKPLR
ncbi:hypothetical protein CAJAP_01884 [Camponotus japonicus]